MILYLLSVSLIVSVICDDCVTYDFEKKFETLFNITSNPCRKLPSWSPGSYSSIYMKNPNPSSNMFISPQESLSCASSFPFRMSAGGIVEVNYYIYPKAKGDQFTILVFQDTNRFDPAVSMYSVSSLTSTSFGGWNQARLNVFGSSTFLGYVTFLGKASRNSVLLIDSFRYIPPTTSEANCPIYSEKSIKKIDTELTTVINEEVDTSTEEAKLDVNEQTESLSLTSHYSDSTEISKEISTASSDNSSNDVTPEIEIKTTDTKTLSYSTTTQYFDSADKSTEIDKEQTVMPLRTGAVETYLTEEPTKSTTSLNEVSSNKDIFQTETKSIDAGTSLHFSTENLKEITIAPNDISSNEDNSELEMKTTEELPKTSLYTNAPVTETNTAEQEIKSHNTDSNEESTESTIAPIDISLNTDDGVTISSATTEHIRKTTSTLHEASAVKESELSSKKRTGNSQYNIFDFVININDNLVIL